MSSTLKGLIIAHLMVIDGHKLTRIQLMKKMYTHYSHPKELDGVMWEFKAAGMIEIHGIHPDVVYVMPDSQVIELQKFYHRKIESPKNT